MIPKTADKESQWMLESEFWNMKPCIWVCLTGFEIHLQNEN